MPNPAALALMSGRRVSVPQVAPSIPEFPEGLPMPQLEPATITYVVTDDDTAAAVGSGSLPVLGTPRLLAWLEAATCACVEPALADGATSVGTRVQVEHLAASPVGAEVEVTASSAYEDGRLHRFTVSARDTTSGRVLAAGEITRVVVDAERFLSRLG